MDSWPNDQQKMWFPWSIQLRTTALDHNRIEWFRNELFSHLRTIAIFT